MKTPAKQLTINRLKNTSFSDLYKKLLLEKSITDEEKVKLLSIAIVLINHEDENLQRLGYRIALLYSIETKDYKPIYELALNNGLMPVANLINELNNYENSFFNTFIQSHIDIFKNNNIVFTEQQFLLNNFFKEKEKNSLVIIAPTSYGKSELILKSLKQNNNRKICIIVPTKALLAQTRKRILNENITWIKKIVIHHEMYNFNDESSAVFVLTQERLYRLLNSNPEFSFDIVFIDEAHNLLNDDPRSRLLASAICILEHRNINVAFKFLTPFLVNVNNLELRYTQYKAEYFKIDEYVKSECLYLIDFRERKECSFFYDQFLNQFFNYPSEYKNHVDLITQASTSKNIIYVNSPKKLQEFAVDLAKTLPVINCPILQEAYKELAKNINGQYLLIDCLEKGVVYHHGSVPDTIRLYIENLFNYSENLKYLVSSSTLLEGVNLPIDTLFLLSNQKGKHQLSPSQFKNLIGRVNRFSEVFGTISDESIKKLAPKIYVVGSKEFVRSNANLKNFVENVMSVQKTQKDDVKNELLLNTKITDMNKFQFKKTISQLENVENGIIDNYKEKYATTKIGYLLFSHDVQEIDIFDKESIIQDKLDKLTTDFSQPIKDSNTLLKVIVDCFISESIFFEEIEKNKKKGLLSRLKKTAAQTFYAMLIDWKIERLSMNEMVQRMLYYWNNLPVENTIVYVGKWGDMALNDMPEHIQNYTDIKIKTEKEKINLAILRIKEEEDFLDNNIFKFVDILYEFGLIDDNFFKKIKYGTDDPVRVELIKNGFSLSLSDLMLSENYFEYLVIEDNNNIYIKKTVIDKMQINNEGSFIIFEAGLHTK